MTTGTQSATREHKLSRRIVTNIKGTLRRTWDIPLSAIFPMWFNKRFCSTAGLWDEYFPAVEKLMDKHWTATIWPLITDCDFDVTLELGPGAGRNTARLAQVARCIHAVDYNEYALQRLRDRFHSWAGPCELHFHRNRGSDLAMIGDQSVTFIYSWDAAVHFDKRVMSEYVSEFARVLKTNGMGFIHHSNLGATAYAAIRANPHWRSNVSKELFAEYCVRSGLDIVQQVDLPWTGPDGTIMDCLSIFRQSGDRDTPAVNAAAGIDRSA
jgi:SAM-dependent methyltransferase